MIELNVLKQTDSECCLIKFLPYILFEKYADILSLEMASRGNGPALIVSAAGAVRLASLAVS